MNTTKTTGSISGPLAVTTSKKKSIWSREVILDVKPLIKSIAKGLTHTLTGKTEELGNDLTEFASSLGIDTPIEELLRGLLTQGIYGALLDLTRDNLSHLPQTDDIATRFSYAVEKCLDNVEIEISGDFFNKPGQHAFVAEMQEIFNQWLCDVGMSPREASSISVRFPEYFTFAISNEWRKNSASYKLLAEYKNSPFKNAEENIIGWRLYFSFLEKRVSEAVFDEPFSLKQIYIPLNAYFTEAREKTKGKHIDLKKGDIRVCVDLAEELKFWLRNKDKADAIRVISGGPGSGKSSFTKMFCCDLANSGLAKPIYIPLHLIDPTKDVATEVEKFIKDEGLLGFNPLDTELCGEGLLLVFDGLDELASMGKSANQVVKDFVLAVEKMIERRNLGRHPIFVLLSGRELIIQQNETEFRKPKQILTILPYYVRDDLEIYIDAKGLLKIDLREFWWRTYGELVGTNYTGLPSSLRLPEIDEITAQPLLNYLVALSFRRGNLEFSEKLNLNSVYQDLVIAVHERSYENSRTYLPIKHLTKAEFVRVLEEIGLAAWHGSDGRSTSVKNIMDHCNQSGLTELLTSFTEGASAGVTKLLAAFFFRRNGENVGEDAVFIFTHKSFGEYLTARRIVRGLETLVLQRDRRRKSADDGYDVNQALVFWLKLVG
ncbi:hypothetical protein [Undibacterium sp. Ji49W]|uniref:hypothetical protein n=1 Tax=Undibacterium sp. Ji49W TaxID=3413040 RepID=UPI003BF0823E